MDTILVKSANTTGTRNVFYAVVCHSLTANPL